MDMAEHDTCRESRPALCEHIMYVCIEVQHRIEEKLPCTESDIMYKSRTCMFFIHVIATSCFNMQK